MLFILPKATKNRAFSHFGVSKRTSASRKGLWHCMHPRRIVRTTDWGCALKTRDQNANCLFFWSYCFYGFCDFLSTVQQWPWEKGRAKMRHFKSKLEPWKLFHYWTFFNNINFVNKRGWLCKHVNRKQCLTTKVGRIVAEGFSLILVDTLWNWGFFRNISIYK